MTSDVKKRTVVDGRSGEEPRWIRVLTVRVLGGRGRGRARAFAERGFQLLGEDGFKYLAEAGQNLDERE